MSSDIVYVCHSTNNKNVRGNELKILRKVPGQLYFEFGENEMNVKKRYYDDQETLDKDFKALENLKDGAKSSNNNKNMNREENGRKYNMLKEDEE